MIIPGLESSSNSNNQEEAPRKDAANPTLEFFKEAIGYENGLWRTFVDVRKNPQQVIADYLAQTRKYVSPFRFLTTSLGLWILINGFIIDWYATWSRMITGIITAELKLIALLSEREMDQALFDKISAKMVPYGSQIAGDLFAKWTVPFVVIIIIATSHWLSRYSQWKEKVSHKMILGVMCYGVGGNIPAFLIMTTGLALAPWITMGVIMIAFLLILIGKLNLLSYSPYRNFFAADGVAIERSIAKVSVFTVITLQILLVAAYIAYFNMK